MRQTDRIRLNLSLVMVIAGLLLVLLFSSPAISRAGPAAPQACVAGPHTGTISVDETWCAVDSPHIVNAQVTVLPTVTLAVEPGVTIMASSLTHLLIQGNLEALGTPTQPITFTSTSDSGPGQWGGLAFDGGTGHLRYVTVRYTGQRNVVSDLLGAAHRSGVSIRNGTLQLENVTLRDQVTGSYDYGLIAINSQLMLTGTLFTDIGGSTYSASEATMRLQGPDTVLAMSGCAFVNNVRSRVILDTGAMMGHDTTLIPQSGLEGYEISADFVVPPTVTLTVEPGVTIMAKWVADHNPIVQGHLEALGTASQPITFTSVADSGPNQWSGLVFDGGTGDLRYATVRCTGIATTSPILSWEVGARAAVSRSAMC